jgi:F0F1-type ATP synthase assembly protein I
MAKTLAYLGTLNALCVLTAMAVGWGIDSLAGTTPLFILVFLPLGILGGVVVTIRVVHDYLGQ